MKEGDVLVYSIIINGQELWYSKLRREFVTPEQWRREQAA